MTQMDRLRTLARDRGLSVDAIETRDPGIERTMHEFKRGQLHSGSKTGKKVTSRKQAIAIGLSKQRRGDAFTYQKAKRPTMLKSPSSPSADAATQWDRIRRRALDRGLVLDAGTSEGAKKAAATRKAHGGGASRTPTPKRFPANPQNLSRAGHRSMQGYHEQRAAYYHSKGEHEHAAQHEEVARRHARSAGSK